MAMRDVFISYSSKDEAIAAQLASTLKANGLSVFFDKTSLVAGAALSASLPKEIEGARAVVVILSRDARSRFVEKELAHALESRKDVIPVLYGPAATENWVWPLIADRSAVAVDSPRDLEKVVDRVKRSLGVQPRDWRQLKITAIPIAVGFLAAIAIGGRDAAQAGLWATTLLTVGALPGFLFGIPRTLQSRTVASAGPDAADRYWRTVTVNTNLEEISDWLTKIIIGAVLVEAREIPILFSSVATQIAATLPSIHDARSFAIALVVYFTSVGFVSAYLLTRQHLVRGESQVVSGSSRVHP